MAVRGDNRRMTILNRAYSQHTISNFLETDQSAILGELTKAHTFDLNALQRDAWIYQIKDLQQQLINIDLGHIFFEFSIPRMGKRVDVILFINGVVFVLEYKVGSTSHDKQATDQVIDYSLDLKNFHEGSHDLHIIPILISTRAPDSSNSIDPYVDKIVKPLLSNGSDLEQIINQVLDKIPSTQQDQLTVQEWLSSGYKPTPTIVEAAQALYGGHTVENISRSDSGSKNLSQTSECILEIIDHSKKNHRKSICFITGVPGSGKTLAGLNIATRRFDNTSKEHAVFLSGNGPLVNVLREALARDEVERAKENGESVSKQSAKQKASTFIQNIHHFRDEGLRSPEPPSEHVVIFDEAQRAWNQKQTMKKIKDSQWSEPEFLIRYMDRKTDWCTIICLIGGGQEINTGESGLIEWFNALEKNFAHWDIYHSGQLTDKTYNWGSDLESKLASTNATEKSMLHLDVSIRSFRTEKLSDFVNAVIDGDSETAKQIIPALNAYPIAITRNLDSAKLFLINKARGTERTGLVASSGAKRLRPEGIYVPVSQRDFNEVSWFLNSKEDVRSSYYLEEVATEFGIQGLELDWTGLCWDADLRMKDGAWTHYNFKGTRWQKVNDPNIQAYLANAYRVLLTRARQGIIIFVPKGDDQDFTRLREFYEETFTFFKDCGIECID